MASATCLQVFNDRQTLYRIRGRARGRHTKKPWAPRKLPACVEVSISNPRAPAETLVFESTCDGARLDEIGGIRGARSHRAALRRVGVTRIEPCKVPGTLRRKR